MNPLLALMLLFRADTGEVQQFGHVDGFPHKQTNEVERVITQDELEWLKVNMPARVTASNTLERLSTKYAEYDAAMDAAWPVLASHPSAEDVPSDGMTYRLNEDGVITWWVARRGDLLATQLSAHDKDGSEIVRTVNLRTGDDVTINLRKITQATKFQDLRDSKAVKTNAVIRGRGGR